MVAREGIEPPTRGFSVRGLGAAREVVIQHLVEFVREGGSSRVGDGGGGVVHEPIVAKVWPKASSGSNCVSFYRAR